MLGFERPIKEHTSTMIQ